MSRLSRRSVLRATAASAALAPVPASIASPTIDPVVEFGKMYDTVWNEMKRTAKAGDREAYDALTVRWEQLSNLISITAATSAAGVAVKLRILLVDFQDGETKYTEDMLRMAIADADRLARGAA